MSATTRRSRCESCGRVFVWTPNPKGGTPKRYCDADCAKWNRWYQSDEAHRLREVMQERMRPNVWTTWRSELWRWLNSRPWNKGVPKNKPQLGHSDRRRADDKSKRRRSR